MSYLPTFQTTAGMLNLVAEIVELTHAFDINPALVPSPTIRRINQMRTVHSSTWIEGNTLTLDEVTAVIDGKRVVAPEREILEVKQAFAAYDAIANMDPRSLDDLLQAHGIMMRGIKPDAGELRQVEVGVYSGGTLIHAGTPAAELPAAMIELFTWLDKSKDHPLIQGCFFHCAFEGIHPFSDGNGRTGRLWHSLINRSWKPILAWVPVESMVAQSQQDYYRVLRVSNSGEATDFIEFMLEMTRDALTDVFVRAENGYVGENVGETAQNVGENVGETAQNVGENDGDNPQERIVELLTGDPSLSAAKLADRLGLSTRHIERVLAELREAGIIERSGSARGGHWIVRR
ncbi:MAG: Fic family protein [Eggerthellaceae bacterium]|nr:Fic family protein [Eggerthellaceae bacterium]